MSLSIIKQEETSIIVLAEKMKGEMWASTLPDKSKRILDEAVKILEMEIRNQFNLTYAKAQMVGIQP